MNLWLCEGSNGVFMHWQVSGLAICVAACFSSPNVQGVDCVSFQPFGSQHNPSRMIFGLHSPFCTTIFAHHSIHHCPPNVNISDAASHVQLAKNFGENFFEWHLVLGKLSNTVKWCTFCVSFIHALTILGRVYSILFYILLLLYSDQH